MATETNSKALYMSLFVHNLIRLNEQIFVYNCVFRKKEKQHSPNLPFENENTFWKWKHISKNNHILKMKDYSETWCTTAQLDNVECRTTFWLFERLAEGPNDNIIAIEHGMVVTTFYYYSKSSIWFTEKHIFKIIIPYAHHYKPPLAWAEFEIKIE